MAVDTQQILQSAEKLGGFSSSIPPPSVSRPPRRPWPKTPTPADCSRISSGNSKPWAARNSRDAPSPMPSAWQIEGLQAKIVSHIKIKNLNLAQVEFVDLLRKISQTYQRPLADTARSPRRGKAAGLAAG